MSRERERVGAQVIARLVGARPLCGARFPVVRVILYYTILYYTILYYTIYYFTHYLHLEPEPVCGSSAGARARSPTG